LSDIKNEGIIGFKPEIKPAKPEGEKEE